jgi:hypothetical protein
VSERVVVSNRCSHQTIRGCSQLGWPVAPRRARCRRAPPPIRRREHKSCYAMYNIRPHHVPLRWSLCPGIELYPGDNTSRCLHYTSMLLIRSVPTMTIRHRHLHNCHSEQAGCPYTHYIISISGIRTTTAQYILYSHLSMTGYILQTNKAYHSSIATVACQYHQCRPLPMSLILNWEFHVISYYYVDVLP